MNKKTILLVVVAFIVGGFFIGRDNIPRLLPFAIFLICPLMMIFMMSGKNHKH